MFVYDSTSLAFIQKSETLIKDILKRAGIDVRTSRFEVNRYLYPIHVVVFEGSEIGHFNSAYLQIGLNRKLIYSVKDSVLREILQHELAHYLTFILHGEVQPHGKEFHEVCERFGFPKEVSDATMNIEESNQSKVGDLQSEKILERVKKLFSLAQSSNAHEAELATVKANEILLRHHLDFVKDKEEPIYMDRLLARKRKDTKITAIYSILKHFIVKPVISQGKNTCCLEVSGNLTNVKLAGYVANFLDRELDVLWDSARTEFGLQGLQAKNSFFLGVAQGFDQKMKVSVQNLKPEDQKALVVIEKKLTINTQMIYGRLSSSRSGHEMNSEANSHGHAKGLSLTIRSAVEGKGKNLYLPESRK